MSAAAAFPTVRVFQRYRPMPGHVSGRVLLIEVLKYGDGCAPAGLRR